MDCFDFVKCLLVLKQFDTVFFRILEETYDVKEV